MTTSTHHTGFNTNATDPLHTTGLRPGRRAGWLCLCAALNLLLAPAFAGNLYWDINNNTAGAGGAGTPTGTWDSTSLNWTLSSLGTATTVAWTNGETAVFAAGTDATGIYTVTLSGGPTAGGVTVQEGTVTLTGTSLTLSGSGAISVSLGAKAVVASQVSGTVGLTKTGDGELVLEGGNDFTGGLTLQLGTLTLDNDSAANSGNISFSNPGGDVTLRTTKSLTTLANNINLGAANGKPLYVAADSGKQLTLNGAISGSHSWIANGAGTVVLGGASDNTFPGAVTVAQGTVIVAKDAALGTTLNGTTVSSGATLGFQGGIEYLDNELVKLNGNGAGSVGAINNVSGHNLFDGTVTLESASSIGATAQGIGFVGPVSGSFALTKVGAGYIDLFAEDNNYATTLISQGSLGVWYPANAGTGLMTVSAGARIEGNGSVPGGITLSGTISPGASPDSLDSGSQTWNGAATYEWEIKTASGTAGFGWDLLNITGGLSIGATPSSKFNLKIVSLAPDNSAGEVSDFDNTQEYNWTVAATTTGVTSFDAGAFTLDEAAFSNDKGGGRFVIRTSGNDLILRFDPKPVITCPANIAQANDPNVCGASIPFFATATDNDTVTPPVLTYKIGSTPITSPHVFPVGMTTVDVTATDSVGNTDTCSFTVTVTDAQAPAIAGLPANITVQTGVGRTTCDQVATWTAPTASDNCAVTSFTSDYNPGDTFPVGMTPVTYTAKDAVNNTTTGSFTVTVQDNTVPVALTRNITRSLALNGTVSIAAAEVNDASSDNCHIASLSVAPNTWGCTVGNKAVTLTVTDDAGNVSTAAATVTITTPAYAPAPHFGQPDVALANPKTDTITDVTLNVGQNLSNSLAKTIGIAVAPGFQFGEPAGVGAGVEVGYGGYPGSTNRFRVRTTATRNEWEIYDTQNSAVAMFVHVVPDTSLTVEVNPATMPGCLEQYTWDLAVTIHGSITQGTIFKTASVCGAHTFPMTFTSYFDQVVTRTGSVTLDDGTAPIALCQPKTIELDSDGHATLNASDIDNSSTDNCTAAASLVKELSKNGSTGWATSLTYDCAERGANTVTLRIKDAAGNASTCTATVTVQDNINPVAQGKPATIQLNAGGAATLTVADIENGSTDNCAVTVRELSKDGVNDWGTSLAYACGELGANTVTLRVADAAGNTSTCTATVTVADSINPVAQCKPATIQLNASGAATLTVADIENGSTDNCAVTVRELSKDGVSDWGTSLTYACGELGANTVTLRVKDAAGNANTCTATVTVQDVLPPTVNSQNISVNLDADGRATITPAQVNNGSTDNCGTVNLASVVPSSFTFCNVGANNVTLTANDGHGNSAQATATVTVVAPAGQPAIVYVDDDYGTDCAEVTFPATGGTGQYYVGYNAFKTVQAAITAVAAGGTVNVAAGTYHEQLTINKALTVNGSEGAVLDGTGLAPQWTTGVKIRSGNVTLNNIDVANFTQDGITAYDNIDMPNLHITNCKISNIQPGYWGFGIYVGYESEGFGCLPPDLTSHLDFSGLLIEGNEITNVHSSAIVVQSMTGTPGTLQVKNNHIHDNPSNSGIWIDCARNLLIENNVVVGNKWGIEFSAYAEAGGTVNGPYSPKDIIVRGNFITNSTYQGVALYEAWPGTITITENSIQGNGTGLQNYLSLPVNAASNWWGSVTGPTVASNPGGVGNTIVGLADFSPWLGDGTDAQPTVVGFQPNLTPIYYTPASLVFAIQPVGAALGSPLATQPVVNVLGENSVVASQFTGPVTIALAANPGGGELTGTLTVNAIAGVATFTDLAMTVGGGSGFTLTASAASPITSATSATFDIANPAPTLASMSPFWKRAGDAEFTLTVTGSSFVPNSKVQWDGAVRPTTFVDANTLTAVISAGDIATAGTKPVTVLNEGPDGGTSSALTFRIEGATPTVVYVDDGFVGLSPDTLVDWPHTGAGTHIIGYDAFATIQSGVNAVASAGTVNVAPGTYAELVSVPRTMQLLNHTPLGAVITAPGSADKAALINVDASGVTISGFDVIVNQPHATVGVFMDSTVADPDTDLSVLTNRITITGTGVGGGANSYIGFGTDSMAIAVNGDGAPSVQLVGNQILPDSTSAPTAMFDRAIYTRTAKGVISGNTVYGDAHDLVAQFVSLGTMTVSNNFFLGKGGRDVKGAQVDFTEVNGNGAVLFINNTVTPFAPATPSGSQHVRSLMIKNNSTGAPISIIGNTFTEVQAVAILSGNSKNTLIKDNTFTPKAGDSDFVHVQVGNKAPTGGTIPPVEMQATIQGNLFGASTVAGGRAVEFLNHNASGATFGAITIGGAGALANSFAAGLDRFIHLDAESLADSTSSSRPYYGVYAATVMAPFAINLDATGNLFDVGSGLENPSAMSPASLYALENKIDHAPDVGTLGLVRVKVANVYVTTASGSIQRGINAATAGDTVNVAAGTFTEQLEIAKDITLDGQGATTIVKSPATLPLSYTTSAANKPVVHVHDTANAIVSDLFVNGDGKGNANYRMMGVSYYRAGGLVSNLVVQAVRDTPFSGAQHGNAIYAYADAAPLRNLEVVGCTVSDFQKNGITMNGAYLVAAVHENTVTGAGPTAVTAQNAIQFGFGSTGTISQNEVSGIDYTPDTAAACGILVYQSGVAISQNIIASCQTGIGITDPLPSMGAISENSLTANEWSLSLYFSAGPGFAVSAVNNWWGSPQGPTVALNAGGNGTVVEAWVGNTQNDALLDFSPWLGSGADTSGGIGFQPNPAPVYYTPHHLVFSTEPGGAGINAPLTPQPVVQVIDEHSTLATAFNGSVTLAINTGTEDATLSTTLTQPVVNGVATFSGLQIDRAGTYTLSAASASPVLPATSSSFAIANSLPSIASLSPAWAVAGDAGFTLTVNGSDFVYNSVVRWNGSDRITTFVNSGQLTATITATDIAAVGNANVTVFNVAPGGGESSPASFEIKSVPTVVWVDDSFTSGSAGGHLWGYDAFTAVQAGVNRVDASGTVNVAAGNYNEAVNANKPVTLLGADSASPCGGSQSVINGGAGTAVTINAVDVTVKGFELQGVTGVSDTGFTGAVVQNNKVMAVVQGVAMQGIAGAFTVKDNCVNLPGAKDVSGNPTIGVMLASLSGGGQVVDGNNVSGPLYGYLLADVDATSPVAIQGGSIVGVMQGVAVINYDLLFAQKNSTFKVDGVSMSGFTGTSANPARNFHAGVYVFTGGADPSATVTGTIANVMVDGTGKVANDCAGLSFADFSTGIGTRQAITVVNCAILNNLNRGINVRSSNAVVSVTGSTLSANGADPFGPDGNDGFGIIARNGAQVSVNQCFITNPASQAGSYPVAALVTSAEGVMPGGTLTANNCSIDNNGNPSGKLARNLLGTLNASGNWWGGTGDTGIAALIDGLVDFTPYLHSGTDVGGDPADGFQGDFSSLHVTALGAQSGLVGRVQEGHDLATAGGTVSVEAGTYTEAGQVVISKDLSIVGADKLTTIIKPDSDTGNSGDARGWFLVGAGRTFNLQKVTLDGTGHQVYHGLRHHGSGAILDCAFASIRHGVFEGTAIAAYGPGNIDVTGCTFANIGRNGVATYDAPTGTYSGNTYTGKGAGNWMDYAFLIQWGASVTVQNNVISDCVGVYTEGANSWGSSGIAVWDDPDTAAVLTGNALNNNSVGLAVAVISGTDWGTGLEPVVNIGAGNTFIGGEIGVDIENVGVTAASPAISFGASTFKGQSSQAISFQTGMSEGISYDISSVIFKDNADVVITDNFAKEDLVYHVVDAYDRGLLVWNASQDYVTPLSASIQRGVDAASAGWTVNVKSGSYTENVNVNKALALSLGASPAQVVVNGNWTMTSGSSLVMELNGPTPGADYDQLVVNGTVNLGGATLSATSAFSYAAGVNVILIANDGTDQVAGTFAGLPSGSTLTLGGQEFTIYYNGGDGNDVVLFRSGDLGTFATVQVDDNFPNAVPGQDPDADGPAQYFMYDSFPTVQGGVNAVASGGTVNVAAGNYAENVTVNKAVTLKGANFGVAGCTGRGSESTIVGGMGTALTIASDDVTVDGFAVTGLTGISARNHIGVAVQNNAVTAIAVGIDAGTFATTALKNVSLAGNCITLAGQLAGSTPTVGLVLTGVSGAQAPVVSGNTISGAFYGYLLYAVQADVPTVVSGGTVTGVKQGVAVINVDPLTGTVYLPSTFTVDGVSLSGFTGDHPASPANNFHAGVYVFTGGSDAAAKITGTVKNVSVAGTGKIQGDCAALSFADYSTGAGTRQDITVQDCTLENNANRGINIRGANAEVDITRCTLTSNGGDPIGTGGNHGFGIIVRSNAVVTVSESFITNPGTQVGYTVTALAVDENPTVTVSNCSIDNNGNASGKLAMRSSGTLNASGNWWGDNVEAIIAGLITGSVDFTPYLDDGTDTDANPANGFQGDFGILHVTTFGAQTGSSGRVQEGHDLASGSTVIVEAGTYAESVSITKDDFTLKAAQNEDADARNPRDAESIMDSSAANGVIQIAADNVTIDGMKIGASAVYGVFVTGESANVQVLNTIVAGASSDGLILYRASSATVEQCWIQNCALTGISGGDSDSPTHLLTEATIQDNKVENCRFGISGYLANSTISGNEVGGFISTTGQAAGIGGQFYDSVISDNSISSYTGAQQAGIGLAGRPDLSRPAPHDVSIEGNTVSGAYAGIYVAADTTENISIINDNSVTGCTIGVGIYGTATVMDNAASFTGNGIGILVSGATAKALIEKNDLTANSVAGIRVENGATVDAGDCNGGDVTGLGSSAGGNTLNGYSGSVPAIVNANAGGTPAVLGYQNDYGITAGTSLASVLSGSVLASQSGGLLVTPALPPVTVECVGDVPVAVNTLAAFEGLGGAVSATAGVTVSSSDGSLTPGPTEGTITRTYTLTDVCGQTTTSTQLITVNDTIAPLANAGSIAVCYTTVAAAEAAAIAATTVSDNCTATPSITKTASTVGLDPATVTVTVGDLGGNSTSVSYTTRIDDTAPVITATTATQSAASVKNGAATVLQGTGANAVQITVVASDTHLVVPPTIALVNGASNEVAVFDSQSPPGTFNYHWDVTPSTANGTWTATVTASDLCNDTTSVFTLDLNKTEVTGTVQLEGFVGNVTNRSRTVTFVATTNSPTVTNVVATWSVTLTNLSGDEFAYRLTGVPAGTTGLSAKTDWHLRRRLPAALDVNGQAVVNFSGIGGFLKAGDIAHVGLSGNAVVLDDYTTLVGVWFGGDPVADINGDGIVNVFDYALLSFNWYITGDPQ